MRKSTLLLCLCDSMSFSEIFPRTKHLHNSSLPKFKMASLTISHILCYFLIYATTSQLFCANAQPASYKNISLGSSLYANDENLTWTSPSGDFVFGFRPLLQSNEDKFLLAIWFARIPEKTIVWTANGNFPTDRESKVELTTNGQLVLKTPSGWELWKSYNVNQTDAVGGAMLDTGNFVIASNKSGSNIWESFNDPRDTILPGQVLGVGSKLLSTLLENDYRPGKFQLMFRNGNVVLVQIDVFTGNPYAAYFRELNVSQLIFNESGHIQVMKVHNSSNSSSMVNLTPENMTVGKKDLYLRAKLNFDGVLTLYSHPKNISSGNETWSVMFFIPDNICLSIIDTFGSGPCGFNSICELGKHGKPICRCPPGFSPLDPNNQYNGCKQDDVSYLQQCNQEGSNLDEDRFEFVAVDGADWPLADYEQLKPSTEFECRRACLRDCYCAVAIFREKKLVNEMGTCWKKKLPLSNGRFDPDVVDRKALFKIPKSNSSSNNPLDPNSDAKDQDRTTLILAVLLGTSVFFNFFSVTAIILAVYCLFQRKLQGYFAVSTVRDMELNNLRSFTYKDLEVATNGFKEELGRGAFGTVYKGVLALAFGEYVAVKKLDKMQQEGEKEFKTEVNVIGQTHHRNLVRLLGYCNEGEHRILVYEFMHNGSLSSFLFGIIRPGWQQRLQIVSGIARGLMYLHEECSTQIIHCDIKPQNILLDDTYMAKISDFGLAKLLINNHTKTLTGIRGTKGYVAPEWFRNTPVTVKVDVYSFGIVLLEILCCRKSVEMEMEKEAILADWAYECYKEGRLDYLVENDEEAKSDMRRLEKMVKIGIWCVQDEPLSRPSIRAVTQMLDGVLEVSPPPCPFLFS